MVLALIAALDATHLTPKYQVGSVYYYNHPTYGVQKYRYIQNTSGASIGANLGAMQENGTSVWNGILSGAACAQPRFLGLRQTGALADTYYGWVLADGYGLATSNGTTGANAPQKALANGRFDDGAVGSDELFVHACEAQNVAGSTFLCRVMAA